MDQQQPGLFDPTSPIRWLIMAAVRWIIASLATHFAFAMPKDTVIETIGAAVITIVAFGWSMYASVKGRHELVAAAVAPPAPAPVATAPAPTPAPAAPAPVAFCDVCPHALAMHNPDGTCPCGIDCPARRIAAAAAPR